MRTPLPDAEKAAADFVTGAPDEKTKKATYVYLNTDNDKAAEAVIKLKGALDLQKSWFVL